jgi:predicted HTH transcriptional regulator
MLQCGCFRYREKYKEDAMGSKLSGVELKKLIQGGETNTVELKVAAPRAVEMAERLCGMANAQGGVVIIGVKDTHHEIVGVPDHRIGETLDVILRAVRQMIKPELVLSPSEPEFIRYQERNSSLPL